MKSILSFLFILLITFSSCKSFEKPYFPNQTKKTYRTDSIVNDIFNNLDSDTCCYGFKITHLSCEKFPPKYLQKQLPGLIVEYQDSIKKYKKEGERSLFIKTQIKIEIILDLMRYFPDESDVLYTKELILNPLKSINDEVNDLILRHAFLVLSSHPKERDFLYKMNKSGLDYIGRFSSESLLVLLIVNMEKNSIKEYSKFIDSIIDGRKNIFSKKQDPLLSIRYSLWNIISVIETSARLNFDERTIFLFKSYLSAYSMIGDYCKPTVSIDIFSYFLLNEISNLLLSDYEKSVNIVRKYFHSSSNDWDWVLYSFKDLGVNLQPEEENRLKNLWGENYSDWPPLNIPLVSFWSKKNCVPLWR